MREELNRREQRELRKESRTRRRRRGTGPITRTRRRTIMKTGRS
jgi:hypothetical protein